jgi:uncharacterized protein (TIGR02646 family)
MTLVEIDISKEPACLKALSSNPAMTYETDLQGECRIEVRELLKREQNNLCAYCQKDITGVMTIEHYIAQSDVDNNGQNLQLNFSNFLGVCTGKFYLNRMTGTHAEHCDTSRRKIPLQIDPRIPEHINTISYTDDFKIISSDHDFNSDLNTILNLNIDGICNLRQSAFNRYLELISENWTGDITIEFYQKTLRDLRNNPPEYYGYIKYRFEQLLKNEVQKLELDDNFPQP